MEQPNFDAQKALSDLMNAGPETVDIGGRRTTVGWLHKDTEQRISRLMMTDKDAEKRLVKWYSLVRLDFRSGLLTWIVSYLWHWLYWRWLWYVSRERCTVFQMGVIAASKKKIQQRSEMFALSTILTIGAMDTMMTMARHEAGPAGPPMVPVTP